MTDQFKIFVQSKIKITDAQFEALVPFMEIKKVKKSAVVQEPGTACSQLLYVQKGLLRKFGMMNDKENIIEFAGKNTCIADFNSFLKQSTTLFIIDAIEDSEVIVLTKDFFDKMAEIDPRLFTIVNMLLAEKVEQSEKRVILLQSGKVIQRYLYFLSVYSELATRLPVMMQAAYIKCHSNSLSRIRNEITKIKEG